MYVKLVDHWEVVVYEYGNQDNDFEKHKKEMESEGWKLLNYDLVFGTYRRKIDSKFE